jgi:hypothetical protein
VVPFVVLGPVDISGKATESRVFRSTSLIFVESRGIWEPKKKAKISNSTRSKGRFKASVSHEIEVPLFTVIVSPVLSVTVFPLFLLFQGMLDRTIACE